MGGGWRADRAPIRYVETDQPGGHTTVERQREGKRDSMTKSRERRVETDAAKPLKTKQPPCGGGDTDGDNDTENNVVKFQPNHCLLHQHALE
jgi:hypothetical protein